MHIHDTRHLRWASRGTRRAVAAFALAAAALSAACGSSPTGPSGNLAIACPTVPPAESASGGPMVVNFPAPTVTGTGSATATATCTPQSGSTFQVGDTKVTCATSVKSANASCSFTVTVTPPPQLLYTRFLGFGDSITEGKLASPVISTALFQNRLRQLDIAGQLALLEQNLISSPATAYETVLTQKLAARYPQQTFNVLNGGVGGESAASGAFPGVNRFPSEVSAPNPQVVLLMEGTNDLLSPSGADPAIQALDSMISVALSQGRRVVLATIPPERPSARRPGVAGTIPGFNDRIRALATARQVALCDVYNALKDDVQHYIGDDDLHPTVAGYQVIGDTFYKTITGAFEQGGSTPRTTLSPLLGSR